MKKLLRRFIEVIKSKNGSKLTARTCLLGAAWHGSKYDKEMQVELITYIKMLLEEFYE